MLPLKLSALTILAALALPLAGFAEEEGGGSTGGGNSVNHKLVEDYAIDFSQVKGSKEFEQKLKMVENALPIFGQALREQIENMTWYILPRSIKELPKEKIGLSFRSEQVAVQSKNEVFIDSSIFDKFSSNSAAKLFMHEILMGITSEKQSSPVRKVVTKIFDPEITPRALQKTLAQEFFGANFTKGQMHALSENERGEYLNLLGRGLENASERCSNINQSIQEIQAALGGDASYPEGGFQEGFVSPFILSVERAQTGIRYAWLAVYRNALDRKSKIIYSRCTSDSELFVPALCSAFMAGALASYNIEQTIHEAALHKKMYSENYKEINKHTSRDRLNIFTKLTENPAFINILAMDRVGSDEHGNWTVRYDVAEDPSYPKDAITAKIKQAFKQTQAAQLPEKHADFRKLLCDSIASVKKMVEKMRSESSSAKPTAGSDREEKSSAIDAQ